jgi:hypothetical protein
MKHEGFLLFLEKRVLAANGVELKEITCVPAIVKSILCYFLVYKFTWEFQGYVMDSSLGN